MPAAGHHRRFTERYRPVAQELRELPRVIAVERRNIMVRIDPPAEVPITEELLRRLRESGL
jgi:hypothetical protein